MQFMTPKQCLHLLYGKLSDKTWLDRVNVLKVKEEYDLSKTRKHPP